MTKPNIATINTKPYSIDVIGPAFPAWQELCVHVRNGYILQPDRSVEILPNGNAMFTLVLGTPDEAAIARAKESVDLGLKQQEARYQKDVREEAKRLVEQEKREQLAKQVAEEVAAHEKKIAQLQKAAEEAASKP